MIKCSYLIPVTSKESPYWEDGAFYCLSKCRYLGKKKIECLDCMKSGKSPK